MTKSDREADPSQVIVVWIARLPELRGELPALQALLDARELERAGKFRFPDDRARFVLGRGLLRLGLRQYAPQVPATMELAYSSLGRPLVPDEHESPRFSISHTHDWVALAFANRAQVGVDLEWVQPLVDLRELAERILSEEDFGAFEAFPHAEKQVAFYRAWIRKEAYLKARGEGIGTGLQDVSVSFSADTTTSLTDRRDASATSWRLHTLPVPEEYMGCVACDEAARPMSCFSARVENGAVRLEPIA